MPANRSDTNKSDELEEIDEIANIANKLKGLELDYEQPDFYEEPPVEETVEASPVDYMTDDANAKLKLQVNNLTDKLDNLESVAMTAINDTAQARADAVIEIAGLVNSIKELKKEGLSITVKHDRADDRELYGSMIEIAGRMSELIVQMQDNDNTREERLVNTALDLLEQRIMPTVDKGKKWFKVGKYFGVAAVFIIGYLTSGYV